MALNDLLKTTFERKANQSTVYNVAFPVDVTTTTQCDNLPKTVYQAVGRLLLGISDPPDLAGTWSNGGQIAGLLVRPQAQVYKTVPPAAVLPGDVVTFTVTLSNNTNSLITDLNVVDTLPAGFAFGGMVSGGVPVPAGQSVTWYDQSIPPGGQTTLIFTVTASLAAGNYTNYVKATSLSNNLIPFRRWWERDTRIRWQYRAPAPSLWPCP